MKYSKTFSSIHGNLTANMDKNQRFFQRLRLSAIALANLVVGSDNTGL